MQPTQITRGRGIWRLAKPKYPLWIVCSRALTEVVDSGPLSLNRATGLKQGSEVGEDAIFFIMIDAPLDLEWWAPRL